MKKKIKKILVLMLTGKWPKTIKANIHYLTPSERLKDKRIIITGGARGIGFSMAQKFLSEGAKVLITSRDQQFLEPIAKELGCECLALDMNDVCCFKSFIEQAANKLGRIDCLVNNAGVSLHEESFFNVTPESFDQQINVNFKGAFFLTQAYIRFLKNEKKKGAVLFISSETGITSDIRPYGYTKAAINSMTEGLAYLFAKDDIRINAIAPGNTATDMTGYSDKDNLYFRHSTIERVYLPEEIAEVACFLLSDASACISGQIVVCNNARTVNSRIKIY